jgi:phosphoadenosine phosphosulfate reductase
MSAVADELLDPTTKEGLQALSAEFESSSPETVLTWAVREFGAAIALATGFGPEGCVLVDMLSKIAPDTRIFYLDTDLLFPETYELRDRLEAKYGVAIERQATKLTIEAQAEEFGARLWEREPDRCCNLRKVQPLRQTLSGLDAWITAIRRDQSPARATSGIVETDPKFGLVKINPLANWSTRQVWSYIFRHDVPYNPMHDSGYPSIGCAPCTTAIAAGEDVRSGRWRGLAKTECGLHQ